MLTLKRSPRFLRWMFLLIGPLLGSGGAARAGSVPAIYRYDARQPLGVQKQSVTPFAGGRILRFSYRGAYGERVPALLVTPTTADARHPVPCLVLLHGLGRSGKEMMLPLAQFAASFGYASLAIDEAGLGERRTASPSDGVSEIVTGVPQTVIDLRRGLDYLRQRPEVNPRRVGLLGLSLGAIMGTVAAGVDTRFKTVVLISGGGDWPKILSALAARKAVLQGYDFSKFGAVDWAQARTRLRPVDPLTYAAGIAPRPILMVNGGRDRVIVPEAARELARAARSGRHARLQVELFPEAGHIPPPLDLFPTIQAFLAKTL